LNFLFGYKHEEIKEEVIYVDQYLSDCKLLDYEYEKFIIKNVMNICGIKNIIVKQHTSLFSSEKYKEYKEIKFYNNVNIPWEVVIMNEIYNNESFLNNKILIGYNSTMLINTLILQRDYKSKCNAIFLYNIFQDVCGENYKIAADILCNKLLKNNYRNLYLPKTFFELKQIVKNIRNEVLDKKMTDAEIIKEKNDELDVLKKIYNKNFCKINQLEEKENYIKRMQWELQNQKDELTSEKKLRKYYEEYYILLNKWMELYQENKSLGDYCEKNKYNRILIYGMGNLGKRLYMDLKKSSCKVIGFVDKSEKNIVYNELEKIEITQLKELEKLIDIIIVTPIPYYEDIYSDLKDKGMECKIESLKSLISYL